MHDDKRNDNEPNPWRDDPDPDDPWRDRDNGEEGRDDDLPSFSYRDQDEDPVDIWGEPLKQRDDDRSGSAGEREPSDPDWDSDDYSDDSSLDDTFGDEDGMRTAEERSRDDAQSTPAMTVAGGETDEDGERWPLALIAVAVIALVLLAAGGYGVMQQRGAMQAEITELQARLAESATPDEVLAARRALEDMRGENTEMRALVTSLQEENQRLSDTLAGLEQQVDAQREVTDKAREAAASTPPREEKPKPAPRPRVAGDWFVNFGAYREQNLANDWAGKLRKDGNTVVVMPVDSNGRSLYRVRITGLASESAARQLAGQLEKRFDLAPLWVGRQ